MGRDSKAKAVQNVAKTLNKDRVDVPSSQEIHMSQKHYFTGEPTDKMKFLFS